MKHYLKENIEEVPVFQSIEKQKYIFLEQAQPEDEIEYEIVADVKKMQELVKPIMPKMPVKANRVVVAPEPMRVFAKRYSETRRVVAETVKEFPKLHIDYDAGTMTFNGENMTLIRILVMSQRISRASRNSSPAWIISTAM